MRSARVSPNQGQTITNSNGVKSVDTTINVQKIAVLPDTDQSSKDPAGGEHKNGVTTHPKSILRKDTRYPSPEPTTGLVDFLQRILNPEFDSPALERIYRRYFTNQKRLSIIFLVLTSIVVNIGLIILYSVHFNWDSNLQTKRIVISCTALAFDCLLIALFVCSPKCGPNPVLPRLAWISMLLQLILDLCLNYSPLTPLDSVGMFVFFVYLTYSLLPFRLYSCVAIGLLVTVIHITFTGALASRNREYLRDLVRNYYFNSLLLMGWKFFQ